MHEHQPLVELAVSQRAREAATESRTPLVRRPRHAQRHAMAGRLRRIADRLDG